MRVAVMSDIHGFDLALRMVLADLDARGPFAEVVVAGDLCEVGPAPAEVLAILQERQGRGEAFTVLTGNTDRDVVEAAQTGEGRRSVRFAAEQIGPDGIEYLAGLPFSRRITPPGGTPADDDLLVVHANPHDLDRALHPDLSEREVREILGDVRAAVIAFGHVHIPYLRRVDAWQLVDVSAVGNPKDGDLRCAYGILTWDEAARTWSAEIVRLPYPLAETEAEIRASALPNPEKTLRKLIEASY